MRGAMRDSWILVARAKNAESRTQCRAILEALGATHIEEVAS